MLNLLQKIQSFCCWTAIIHTCTKLKCNKLDRSTEFWLTVSHNTTLYTSKSNLHVSHSRAHWRPIMLIKLKRGQTTSLPVSHSLSGCWAYGESLTLCCRNGKRFQWFLKMWDFSMQSSHLLCIRFCNPWFCSSWCGEWRHEKLQFHFTLVIHNKSWPLM